MVMQWHTPNQDQAKDESIPRRARPTQGGRRPTAADRAAEVEAAEGQTEASKEEDTASGRECRYTDTEPEEHDNQH